MSKKQITIYGIPNCDKTKQALTFLKKNNIEFIFHDYKLKSITKEILKVWIDTVGVELIFNKRSTTWKELNENEKKKAAASINGAIEIMINNNSIIKRPIIEINKELIVGYDEKKLVNLKNK